MISQDKTFALLLDCPSKGEYMLFPGYVEDIKEQLSSYDEVEVDMTEYTGAWSADLARTKYKIYKQRNKSKQK